MNDLAAADRPQFRGGKCCHGDGLAVHSYEFHFEALPGPMYMNDRTNVARLEAVRREIHGQYHAVEFFDHVFGSGTG